MTAHSVAELREAWRAIEAGEFAHGPRSTPAAPGTATVWTPAPSERVVAVVGCTGGVGASTVALALATAAGVPARVVECGPPLASGFSAAANAELGTEGTWCRGSRGDVLLERPIAGDAMVPVPTESSVEWTVVDTNWTTLDPRLQVTGLTPDPLPAPLLKTAQNVLALLRKEPT